MRAFRDEWRFWGRPSQLEPDEPWRTWIFMGGRGAGKTRAGAEWVGALARTGRARCVALVGPTFHDVREVMIDGRSGLRACPRERPNYEASRRRLSWNNGAQAFCFSAEDPESLRGPQFDAAWVDELCFWAYPEETLATLEHAMRIGVRPKLMVTTTPRPIPTLKRLLAARDTVRTHARTWDNEPNLSPDFITALKERWTGATRHRQEILGELVEDTEGALWRHAELDALRAPPPEHLDRVVVGVDPPAGVGENASTCGIVAAGAWWDGAIRRAMVLADASIQGAHPRDWARRVAETARVFGADSIVAEANNGGEMVRAVLQVAAPEFHLRLVRASEGKRARAEPIAARYAQGLVTHAAAFPALEDEMCGFGTNGFKHSPDRLDALVWALTDLMAGGAGPRLRMV